MQNTEEPDAGPGAEYRTPVCQFFGGSADFEVNFLALKEETDGIFLSYTVAQGTPRCVMLLRSPEMNFTRHHRVPKLFCIAPPPLNRGQGGTYSNM